MPEFVTKDNRRYGRELTKEQHERIVAKQVRQQTRKAVRRTAKGK